jgi:radical SAM superfamily enzyme YgiQ (UPF0313 family)
MKSDKLDILLINPSLDPNRDQKYFKSLKIQDDVERQQSPYLGIAYMIAVAKEKGLNIKYHDMPSCGVTVEEVLNTIETQKPTVIGIRAFSVQIQEGNEIAKLIKTRYPDSNICVGGPHAAAVPEETLNEFEGFDFVIGGEVEYVLVRIAKALNKGKPIENIHGVVSRKGGEILESKMFRSWQENPKRIRTGWPEVENLDELPFPAWEEFDLDKYPGSDPHYSALELPMSTSRGCPSACGFCYRQFGRFRKNRSVDSVIAEIERNMNDFGCESIIFTDETFTSSEEWCHELFDKMIERGISKKLRWSCETRVDTCSLEFMKRMKEAGCYYIFFGFESGSDRILKESMKGFDKEYIKQAVDWTNEAGIVAAGSFILGLPGETRATAMETIDYSQTLDMYSITFPIAVPFVGTTLRKQAERGDYGLKILTNDWKEYGKQNGRIMESDELSYQDLLDLQKTAYDGRPKQRLPVEKFLSGTQLASSLAIENKQESPYVEKIGNIG